MVLRLFGGVCVGAFGATFALVEKGAFQETFRCPSYPGEVCPFRRFKANKNRLFWFESGRPVMPVFSVSFFTRSHGWAG